MIDGSNCRTSIDVWQWGIFSKLPTRCNFRNLPIHFYKGMNFTDLWWMMDKKFNLSHQFKESYINKSWFLSGYEKFCWWLYLHKYSLFLCGDQIFYGICEVKYFHIGFWSFLGDLHLKHIYNLNFVSISYGLEI